MFKNGLQCKDEKKFCKSSGEIAVDSMNNKTIYEWNTDNLDENNTIPINYFCLFNIHENDLGIKVSIL